MEVKKMEPGRTRPQVKEQWLFPEFEAQGGGDEVKEVKNKRKRSKK